MATSILTTKLHIPVLRTDFIIRPRLLERLQAGFSQKLILVSAPAGFGKTSVLSHWIAQCNCPIAWLSLDEGDSHLNRFLSYFIVALQKIAPEFGLGLLSVLQSPQQAPIESFLSALVNEIDKISEHFLLVLDDYHLLDNSAIDDAISFLLKHLPPQMHLVIASREDPRLPLARLRVQGQLTELRLADLRFTPDEARDFLNQGMKLNLSAQDVSILESRTEGWIAGLQLAALSMQGRSDPSDFIQVFAGSHRFVLDYLLEEVLQRLAEPIQQFLLQSSILDKLSAALCNALSGRQDSQEILETLERGNMFIVPLDEQGQWYRYHHLFADVLRSRLIQEEASQVALWHRRASIWYEENELWSDAIRHAISAEDFERAADLIERNWSAMRKTRQEASLFLWIKALPEALIRARPELSLAYVWSLLDAGQLDLVDVWLQTIEAWLDMQTEPSKDGESIQTNLKQAESIRASIANARAYKAQALGDLAATVQFTQQALQLMPEDDYYERGTAAALLGLAYWASGHLDPAYDYFADGLKNLQRSGGIVIMLGGTFVLAKIRIAQGRLHEALNCYEQALQIARTQSKTALHGTAELYLGLSEIYLAQGRYLSARDCLQQGATLRGHASLPGYEYLWAIVEARMKELDGDFEAAIHLLDEAERHYYRSPIPNVQPIPALKARVALRAGQLAQAVVWARKRNLGFDEQVDYLHEYEAMTLARVFLAQHKEAGTDKSLQTAASLLERLLQAAEDGNRTGSIIEILALQALVQQVQANQPLALTSLERALDLSEAEAYVQLYLDEGQAMASLVKELAQNGFRSKYLQELLNAFGTVEGHDVPVQTLPEPLTERELAVLRLFATDLDGPEIARELVIALSTLRSHTKSIYSKLAVNSRREAVRRASELHLI